MSIDIGTNNKILIIQPDAQVRETLVEVFKNSGFEVLEAKDGADGLAKASNDDSIDVILTALNMPRIDGMQVIQSIKEGSGQSEDIPIIIFDHLNSEEEKKDALAIGAKDFIAEGTIAPTQIAQVVSRFIQQGRYLLQIDPYALDGPLFVDDHHFDRDFRCSNCGTSLAVELNIYKGKQTTAKIVCPNCGKEYL